VAASRAESFAELGSAVLLMWKLVPEVLRGHASPVIELVSPSSSVPGVHRLDVRTRPTRRSPESACVGS
jgi:hypothetical protein